MNNNCKKKFLAFAVLLSIGFASQASAGYVPLVQIPGVPEGEIDMSAYLVGMYNFLLSIVGIVAVIMLIIGGMKYITAAGNSATVSDAKDTIWSAIFGLMLALLSWVFVSTINPDVLYLKQPGSAFSATSTTDLGSCSTFTGGTCICADGETITAADEYYCEQNCIDGLHCNNDAVDQSCLSAGSATNWYDGDRCICGDGTEVALEAASGECNTYCKEQKHCGGKFLVVKLGARHSYGDKTFDGTSYFMKDEDYYYLSEEEGDEIWDFFLTDDGEYGPFNIKNTEYMDIEIKDASGVVVGTIKGTCAILLTNEDSGGGLDEHDIFWVAEGTTVGREGRSLFDDIGGLGLYYHCCTIIPSGAAGCLIDWGECIYADGAEKVLRAKYGSGVSDECGSCGLSESDSPHIYEFRDTKTCKNGTWQ